MQTSVGHCTCFEQLCPAGRAGCAVRPAPTPTADSRRPDDRACAISRSTPGIASGAVIIAGWPALPYRRICAFRPPVTAPISVQHRAQPDLQGAERIDRHPGRETVGERALADDGLELAVAAPTAITCPPPNELPHSATREPSRSSRAAGVRERGANIVVLHVDVEQLARLALAVAEAAIGEAECRDAGLRESLGELVEAPSLARRRVRDRAPRPEGFSIPSGL